MYSNAGARRMLPRLVKEAVQRSTTPPVREPNWSRVMPTGSCNCGSMRYHRWCLFVFGLTADPLPRQANAQHACQASAQHARQGVRVATGSTKLAASNVPVSIAFKLADWKGDTPVAAICQHAVRPGNARKELMIDTCGIDRLPPSRSVEDGLGQRGLAA